MQIGQNDFNEKNPKFDCDVIIYNSAHLNKIL